MWGLPSWGRRRSPTCRNTEEEGHNIERGAGEEKQSKILMAVKRKKKGGREGGRERGRERERRKRVEKDSSHHHVMDFHYKSNSKH